MRDLTDPKVVRRLEKAARIADRQDGIVMRNLMSTMAGRQYMCKKLEATHVFGSSFNTNALTMAFTEGERNVGLTMLADIMTFCPEQYILMMNERNQRDASRDRSDGEQPGSEDGDGGAEDSRSDDNDPISGTN